MKWKRGRAGVRAYRASGRMFGATFHTGMSCPADHPATCCRCGGLAYFKSTQNIAPNGVSVVPCYGCIREQAEAEDASKGGTA